jgi:hypothetical protein
MTDKILVERLYLLYDPFVRLGIKQRDVMTTKLRVSEFRVERSDLYHAGRVAYMRDEILRHHELEPIQIDNYFNYGSVSGIAVTDGHHRFAAYIMAKCKMISAEYGGMEDILRWLKGEKNECSIW